MCVRSEVIFDAGELTNRLRTLEERMAVPSFWDNNEAAQEVIQEVKTLRGWLDDDIGHRAVRKRVEEASAEWERLLRTSEVLWGQRQLDEARLLEASTLGARERAFLAASRRAVARARWGRWLAALVLVLTVGGSYGWLRMQAYLEMRFIEALIQSAREELSSGRELAQRARAVTLQRFGRRGRLRCG